MRKLCFFTLGFVLGIAAAQYLLPLRSMAWAAAGAFVLAILCQLIREPRRTAAGLAAIGLGAGLLWNFWYDTLVFSHAKAYDGVETQLTATVRDFPVDRDYGAYFDVELDAEGGPALKGRAYVYDDSAAGLRPGDRVTFRAEVSTADRVGEDRITTYTSKGYFLFIRDVEDLTVLESPGPGIGNFHVYLSRAIRQKIGEIFPLGTENFMLALLTGDRTGVNGDLVLSSRMERAGVSHIIAISGMHVSILAGFIMTVFGKRRWAGLACMPVLILFAGISGFSASVVRAVIMQAFILAAPMVSRESDSLTALSAAVLVLLGVNPYAIAGAGLQMSFAATLGIILFTPKLNGLLTKPIPRGRSRVKSFLRYILGGIATSLGALALTLPLTAYYFGTVSLIAPLSNLLILWAVTPAFILGALAVAAGFIYLPAGCLLAWAPAVLVRYIVLAVELCARPMLAAVYLEGPALKAWFALSYGALMALIVFRARAGRYLAVAAVSAAAVCGIFVWNDMRAGAGEGYTLTVLDVGQGQSIAVTSGGYTALIDCGTSGWQDAGEIAERYLRSHGRGRVDLMVLTHYHADHANGAVRILGSMDVSVLAVPEPRFEESGLDEAVISAAERAGTEIIYITEDTQASLGDSVITLLPPLGAESENERGLTAIVTQGDFDTVITGDMPGDIERQLVGKYDLPDAECLLVGHHGSRTSTTDRLLDEVKPELAVISVGENDYGHPTPEVLERLGSRGITVLRTDESGNVTVRSR